MKEIDKIDRKILFELDRNARQTFSQIAKKIKTSKQVVDYRVNRLLQRGIIKGFFTAIDHSKLGYFSFRVYIKLRQIDPKKQQEMVDYLNASKDVWWFVTVDGYWDVDFVILVKDVFDYYTVWERFLEQHKRYIHRYETVVYSHIQGFPKSYLIGKRNEEEGFLISFTREALDVDVTDLKLLRFVSTNARITTVELADKTKMNVKTVIQRMKSLEEQKLIVGYRALIDLGKVGYKYYKIVFYLMDTKGLGAMKAWALAHPNVPYINKTIGGGDFELEVHAQNQDEFNTVLNEFRALFYDSIDHYYYFWVIDEYKMIYYPVE